MRDKSKNKGQRGAALMEFAIGATVFLTVMFAIVEMGRLFWIHNALRDAARRGARYAAVRKNDTAGTTAVKKLVVYGDPNANTATAKPLIPDLAMANVAVEYQNFNGVQLSSRATVTINNYKFKFAVPIVGGTLNLPKYRTSLPGESAGYVPCNFPSGTPQAPCNIIPD